MLKQKTDFYPSILVLMAALDEEVGIGLTLTELGQYIRDPDFLVVDGKSTDRTADVAENFGARVITQSEMGKGKAVGQAIKNVKGDFDFVVMGAHGHGVLEDAMIGSTSRRVLRRCKKPVLVVRLPEDEED